MIGAIVGMLNDDDCGPDGAGVDGNVISGKLLSNADVSIAGKSSFDVSSVGKSLRNITASLSASFYGQRARGVYAYALDDCHPSFA